MRNSFPTGSLKLNNCNKLWREVAWEWPQQRGKQSQEMETLVLMAYFWHMILTISEARLLIYFHFISLFLREFEWVSATCNLRSIAVNILWFPTSMSLLSLPFALKAVFLLLFDHILSCFKDPSQTSFSRCKLSWTLNKIPSLLYELHSLILPFLSSSSMLRTLY